MSLPENIEPREVYRFFEEISAIPHGSGNTKAISDYLVDFAVSRNLEYIQDESNNVIIFKDACLQGITSIERENVDTIILQGHIDMVCEKEEDYDIDFLKDGLKLEIKDGYLSATGTTLGGDDGIAVAYMLAILDSEDIVHPNLECVFTVDEEIGMLGAAALDMSVLKGRKLLNIDSEDEGYMLVSCAGGATVTAHFPVLRRGAQGERFKLTLSGFLGGHSGIEIDKGRANADIILMRLLKELLFLDDSLRLISIRGGFKDNAIPVRSEAYLISKNLTQIEESIDELLSQLIEEYKDSDPDITFNIERIDIASEDYNMMDEVDRSFPLDELQNLNYLMAFASFPYGVQAMSEDIEGLVQTSLNLGILETTVDDITLSFSVRSSINKEKEELIDTLSLITKSAGGRIEVSGEYPAWEYVPDSKLRDTMTATYKEMFDKDMVVQAIHAGVECGLFAGELDGLEAVSFGPDILDIHTPKERMNIESTQRTWRYIKEVLRRLI